MYAEDEHVSRIFQSECMHWMSGWWAKWLFLTLCESKHFHYIWSTEGVIWGFVVVLDQVWGSDGPPDAGFLVSQSSILFRIDGN